MDYLSGAVEKSSCNLGSENLTKRLTLAAICWWAVAHLFTRRGGLPLVGHCASAMNPPGQLILLLTFLGADFDLAGVDPLALGKGCGF
jgi:hypothetical protein